MDDENAKRINIDDLTKPEQELSADEEKNVTGGYSGGVNVAMGDGSVRSVGNQISGNTVGGSIGSAAGNTIGGALGGDVSNPIKR